MEKVDKEKEAREKKALEEHERRSKLFKENRFMFEIERKKEIEALIKSAPPEYQKKLKEMHAEWDRTMKGAGNKYNRLILAEHMLMDHFHNVFKPAVSDAAGEKAE
jgi:hypothetical protein